MHYALDSIGAGPNNRVHRGAGFGADPSPPHTQKRQGDMADERGLDAVRGLKSLVAVDQGTLDALGISDVAIGEECAAVRKWQRGTGDDAAVRAVELALIGAPL